MHQHGGRRPGSGRKPGGLNLKTREIATKAALANLTPLGVMIEAMLEAHGRGDKAAAAAIAKDCAPYVHPRLQTVKLDATVHRDVTDYSDAELAAIIAQGSERDPAPAVAPPDAWRRLN